MTPDYISASDSAIEARVNENFSAAAAGMAFAKHASKCVALKFAIYGGIALISGVPTSIADQEFNLSASTTSYIQINANGSFTVSTSAPTGWPGVLAAGAKALHTVVTGSSTITGSTDHRVGIALVLSAIPSFHSYAYASTVAVETNLYDVAEITLTGNITLNFSGGIDGKSTVVRLRQDATGSRILTLGSMTRLGTDISTVVLSTAANKLDYFVVRYDGTDSKYDVLAVVRGY